MNRTKIMGLSLPKDRQKKVVLTAILVSIFAGAATMFVPVSILERITGVTGLSEIIPATAAPLGDTARALIAFGTGVLTMALMILFLANRDSAKEVSQNSEPKIDEEKVDMIKGERLAAIKDRITNFNLPNMPSLPSMPWKKGDNDIRDLADLPNVRAADQHPDAPPRHPLSVSSEMAAPDSRKSQDEIDLSAPPLVQKNTAASDAVSDPHAGMNEAAEQSIEVAVEELPNESPAPAKAEVESERAKAEEGKAEEAGPDKVASDGIGEDFHVAPAALAAEPAPTISRENFGAGETMDAAIARFENAMAKRKAVLAEITAIAQGNGNSRDETKHLLSVSNKPMGSAATEKSVIGGDRPVLEAVENSNDELNEPKEVDDALNAALATLQKMNAQSR